MKGSDGWRWGLIVLAGVALWLLLAGPEQLMGWDTGKLGMALLVWGCLHLAAPMCRLLGQGGVDVLTRILGLLLAAIAVGMIASGLGGLFPRLV